jgi:hypothetical protein
MEVVYRECFVSFIKFFVSPWHACCLGGVLWFTANQNRPTKVARRTSVQSVSAIVAMTAQDSGEDGVGGIPKADTAEAFGLFWNPGSTDKNTRP